MTQPLNKQENIMFEDDEVLDHIDEEDYIFIIDAEGNLKSVLLPEENDVNSLPDNIQKALQLFGVDHLSRRSLH